MRGMRGQRLLLGAFVVGYMVAAASRPGWPDVEEAKKQALANAGETQKAFVAMKKFIDGWWALRDKDTALIPQNTKSRQWTPENSGADLWPFMVIAAHFVDRPFYEKECLETLRSEQRLTNRVRRLPDDFDLEKNAFVDGKVDMDRIIFGASEYAKDGLIPVVEMLGPDTPYFTRLRELADDILAESRQKTTFGLIPSSNHEVNGNMLQVFSRLWWATRDKRYLDGAAAIAQFYLFEAPPARSERLRLRDHGGEIVNGLCEFYVAAKQGRPELAARLKEPLLKNLDRVLEVGRNEHGLFYNEVNPLTGEVRNKEIADTWGYVMDGYYAMYLTEGIERYRKDARKALQNLNHYIDYNWEARPADGLADSLESALTLLRWEPVDAGFAWGADAYRKMMAIQQESGIFEGWHGDGNVCRSALMWALYLSQGAQPEPYRQDLGIGAARWNGSLVLCITAEQDWKGRIVFDHARHKEFLKMEKNYPRINGFAEWFIPAPEQRYTVQMGEGEGAGGRASSGKWLQSALTVEVAGGKPLYITIKLPIGGVLIAE